jgi:hypothetical protein
LIGINFGVVFIGVLLKKAGRTIAEISVLANLGYRMTFI